MEINESKLNEFCYSNANQFLNFFQVISQNEYDL